MAEPYDRDKAETEQRATHGLPPKPGNKYAEAMAAHAKQQSEFASAQKEAYKGPVGERAQVAQKYGYKHQGTFEHGAGGVTMRRLDTGAGKVTEHTLRLYHTGDWYHEKGGSVKTGQATNEALESHLKTVHGAPAAPAAPAAPKPEPPPAPGSAAWHKQNPGVVVKSERGEHLYSVCKECGAELKGGATLQYTPRKSEALHIGGTGHKEYTRHYENGSEDVKLKKSFVGLLSKGHVKEYDRHSIKGEIVHVNQYDKHVVTKDERRGPGINPHQIDEQAKHDTHRALESHGYLYQGAHPHIMTGETGHLFSHPGKHGHFVHMKDDGSWSSFHTDGTIHTSKAKGKGPISLHMHMNGKNGDCGDGTPSIGDRVRGMLGIRKSDHQEGHDTSPPPHQGVHDALIAAGFKHNGAVKYGGGAHGYSHADRGLGVRVKKGGDWTAMSRQAGGWSGTKFVPHSEGTAADIQRLTSVAKSFGGDEQHPHASLKMHGWEKEPGSTRATSHWSHPDHDGHGIEVHSDGSWKHHDIQKPAPAAQGSSLMGLHQHLAQFHGEPAMAKAYYHEGGPMQEGNPFHTTLTDNGYKQSRTVGAGATTWKNGGHTVTVGQRGDWTHRHPNGTEVKGRLAGPLAGHLAVAHPMQKSDEMVGVLGRHGYARHGSDANGATVFKRGDAGAVHQVKTYQGGGWTHSGGGMGKTGDTAHELNAHLSTVHAPKAKLAASLAGRFVGLAKGSKPIPGVPSMAAHRELSAYGWKHQGDGVYTHPHEAFKGHKVTVSASSGQPYSAVSWNHHTGSSSGAGTGAQSLGYHLMKENQRAGVGTHERGYTA